MRGLVARWGVVLVALAASCGDSAVLYRGPAASAPAPFRAPPTTPLVTTTTRPLTATVVPTTDLVHGQVVKATGELGRLTWRTCAGEYCAFDEPTQDRDLATAPRVVRVVLTPAGPVDCAERPGRCSLRVGDQSVVDVALTFRADAPLPLPSLALRTRDNLAASATVVVTGVTTDELPHLAQCGRQSVSAYENCRALPSIEQPPVRAGADGAFSRSVSLVASFKFGETTIDCRIEACEVRLVIGAEIAARVPLTFAR